MITANPEFNARTIEEISQMEGKGFSLSDEPIWLSTLRSKAWDLFKKLPIESDPNMLKFIQPGKLENLEILYPPVQKFEMTLESKNVNKKLNSLKISVTNKKIITMFPKDIKNQETITITPLFSGIKEKP